MQNRKTSCTFLSIILPDLYGGFSCVSNFGGFWVLSITLKIRKFRSKNKWNALIRVEILRSKWSTTPEVVTGRSVRQPKLTVPFPKILVSSPASLIRKQSFGRNADGSIDSIDSIENFVSIEQGRSIFLIIENFRFQDKDDI